MKEKLELVNVKSLTIDDLAICPISECFLVSEEVKIKWNADFGNTGIIRKRVETNPKFNRSFSSF